MVPVGGSLVYSSNLKYMESIASLYPGRCSINTVLDMFITLLEMGKNGYSDLIQKWEENFIFFKSQLNLIAEEINEKILINKTNDISLAITLTNIRDKASELGSVLFHKGVMGARVVSISSK